jgi:hypothetical protein
MPSGGGPSQSSRCPDRSTQLWVAARVGSHPSPQDSDMGHSGPSRQLRRVPAAPAGCRTSSLWRKVAATGAAAVLEALDT